MKNQFMDVIFTNHAINRLYSRKIAQSDVWYTFKHPDKQTQGKASGTYKYTKAYGSQVIEVIAKQNEKKEWVILSCWSKIIGDNQPLFPQKENYLEKIIKKIGQLIFNKP